MVTRIIFYFILFLSLIILFLSLFILFIYRLWRLFGILFRRVLNLIYGDYPKLIALARKSFGSVRGGLLLLKILLFIYYVIPFKINLLTYIVRFFFKFNKELAFHVYVFNSTFFPFLFSNIYGWLLDSIGRYSPFFDKDYYNRVSFLDFILIIMLCVPVFIIFNRYGSIYFFIESLASFNVNVPSLFRSFSEVEDNTFDSCYNFIDFDGADFFFDNSNLELLNNVRVNMDIILLRYLSSVEGYKKISQQFLIDPVHWKRENFNIKDHSVVITNSLNNASSFYLIVEFPSPSIDGSLDMSFDSLLKVSLSFLDFELIYSDEDFIIISVKGDVLVLKRLEGVVFYDDDGNLIRFYDSSEFLIKFDELCTKEIEKDVNLKCDTKDKSLDSNDLAEASSSVQDLNDKVLGSYFSVFCLVYGLLDILIDILKVIVVILFSEDSVKPVVKPIIRAMPVLLGEINTGLESALLHSRRHVFLGICYYCETTGFRAWMGDWIEFWSVHKRRFNFIFSGNFRYGGGSDITLDYKFPYILLFDIFQWRIRKGDWLYDIEDIIFEVPIGLDYKRHGWIIVFRGPIKYFGPFNCSLFSWDYFEKIYVPRVYKYFNNYTKSFNRHFIIDSDLICERLLKRVHRIFKYEKDFIVLSVFNW